MFSPVVVKYCRKSCLWFLTRFRFFLFFILLVSPPGGASWGILRPGRTGDDITVQELHPHCDWYGCGPALPGWDVLWQIHKTSDSGAEGQVSPAHPGGVRKSSQENPPPPLRNPLHTRPIFTHQFKKTKRTKKKQKKTAASNLICPLHQGFFFLNHCWGNDITPKAPLVNVGVTSHVSWGQFLLSLIFVPGWMCGAAS